MLGWVELGWGIRGLKENENGKVYWIFVLILLFS